MFLSINIILLLFALGSSAHTLSRIQITNGSDIYEIREKPNNMFEIIDPKPKEPTLREIIFFKIIETPYKDRLEKEKLSQEGPDFDDSERPFTNGPGFQFFDFVPIDEHKLSEDDKNSKNNSNSSDSDSNESKNDSNENKNDSHNRSNESKNDNSDNKREHKTENNSESKEDTLKNDSPDVDIKNHDKDNENYNKDNSKGLNKQSAESQNIKKNNDEVTPAVSQDNSTKLLRRKRDIDYRMLPPPPALSPLNVGMFPDFIQRMISNIPALKNIVDPDERSESYDQDESRPRTYGFHLNKDKGLVWNHLPFNDQENYINDPSNTISKEKKEEYQENSSPDSSSDISNSGSDDNSINSDNSGYSSGTDEGDDRNSDNDSIGGIWPEMNAPIIDYNNFKPYNPIIKEKDPGNFVNKNTKDTDNLKQDQPMIIHTTEPNIQNTYKNNKEPETAQKKTQNPKTKININKDLKEKIEMSFDNIGKMVPPTITRFEENLVKTAVGNNETPLTYGMNLSGDHGYVWNDLSNPKNRYLVGETLDENKEWYEPSSPSADNFNEYSTEPASTHESVTEANEPTASPIKETTETVTESSVPSNGPNKESLDKNKDNSDDKKDNEAVQVALDDLLKKDEFWKWLTKWTAAYMEVLNEHVEELVKREVAKQVNKTMNHKNEKEKNKTNTNDMDFNNKNETIANVTTAEPGNKTNEINTNITTTEPIDNSTNNPLMNSTDVNIDPEKDKINTLNKTVSDGHKSNKTAPANAHTIYGNAVDSDHVTNIFIFYPNAENNATAKDIEAILGKTNNNVVVLGKPPNDIKDSFVPDSSTDSPVDDTTGIYAIDKKKDILPNTSEPTNEKNETATNSESATAVIPTKDEPTSETPAKNVTATSTTETSITTEAATNSDKEINTNVTPDASKSNATESTSPNNTESTNNVDTTTAATPDTSTSKR